jgi:hypothetical protein
MRFLIGTASTHQNNVSKNLAFCDMSKSVVPGNDPESRRFMAPGLRREDDACVPA